VNLAAGDKKLVMRYVTLFLDRRKWKDTCSAYRLYV